MSTPRIAGKELASGLLLIGIAGFAALSARGLAVGSGGQMGPGYFPFVLAALLALLGLLLIANSWRGARAAALPYEHGPVPWRGVLMLALGIGFFGLAVRPLGFGPALAVAVGLACCISTRRRWRSGLMVTAGMVAGCWLVFVVALKLPLAFLGSWFH